MTDVEISSSGQNLYMKYKQCMSRYGGILGWGLSVLGFVVIGVRGGRVQMAS